MELFAGFGLGNIIIAFVVGGLIVFLYWLAFESNMFRRGKKGSGSRDKGAPENYDLIALVVDDNAGRIEKVYFRRIHDIVYGAVNTDEPIYFVETPATKCYIYNGVKAVLGRRYGSLIVPIDPETESAISLMESSKEEELAKLVREDVISFIDNALKMQEKKEGTVVVPGVASLVFSFKPSKIVKKVLENSIHNGVVTIRHFFSVMQAYDKFVDYIKAKTEYERVKLSKWTVIGFAIAVVIMAIAIAVVITINVAHPPH